MSKSAPVRIVNGQVLRAGETPSGGGGGGSVSSGGGGRDLESGRSLGSGTGSAGNPGASTFSSLNGATGINFDGNNKYKYGAVFLFLLMFGLRAAVPMVMLYILYQVFSTIQRTSAHRGGGSSASGPSRSSGTQRPARTPGSNIRTVRDLPKPPPSA